jgi:hypothetical protein
MTAHAQYDRPDRFCEIIDILGDYGIVVKERFFKDTPENGSFWRQITDKGVIIVWSEDRTKVVTGWIANASQAMEIYNSRRLPQYLYNRIMSHQKLVREMEKEKRRKKR